MSEQKDTATAFPSEEHPRGNGLLQGPREDHHWIRCGGCSGEVGIPLDWSENSVECPECGSAIQVTGRVLYRPAALPERPASSRVPASRKAPSVELGRKAEQTPIPRPEAPPYSPALPEIRVALPTDLQDTHESAQPSLWNPNAAANWSLLFTPIFGAYLHAANWRALGKSERATANMVWAWATVAFLVINVGTLFLPDSWAIDGLMKGAGLAMLVGWYFSQGKSQAKYVKEAFPGGYLKKSWGAPLAIAIGGVLAYLAVVCLIAMAAYAATAAYSPDPNELAAEVKLLILQEWQMKPELRGATIQKVMLVHKGGKVYTGFVDATLDGQSERLALEVTFDRGTIAWELKPRAIALKIYDKKLL